MSNWIVGLWHNSDGPNQRKAADDDRLRLSFGFELLNFTTSVVGGGAICLVGYFEEVFSTENYLSTTCREHHVAQRRHEIVRVDGETVEVKIQVLSKEVLLSSCGQPGTWLNVGGVRYRRTGPNSMQRETINGDWERSYVRFGSAPMRIASDLQFLQPTQGEISGQRE